MRISCPAGAGGKPSTIQDMLDLILRGGTVIDPAQGTRGLRDVGVERGKITAVETSLTERAERVIDVSGKIVSPGLIDLHAHVFDGVVSNGLDPDLAGVRAGVTTVVMTNDPLDPEEVSVWMNGLENDGQFQSVVRLDRLLREWSEPRGTTSKRFRTLGRAANGFGAVMTDDA